VPPAAGLRGDIHPDLNHKGGLDLDVVGDPGQLSATPGKFWLAKKSIVLCD
jgi:hypothetical protein